MEQKKICMIGAYAVGKTSLVRRFCHGIYNEQYQTTIGVKIDKAVAQTSVGPVTLMLWDLAGEDAFHSLETSYLTSADGLIYVVDTTRKASLEVAQALRRQVEEGRGRVPSIVLANKDDLPGEITAADLAGPDALPAYFTSAKTGERVAEAFQRLAEAMLMSPGVRLQRPTRR